MKTIADIIQNILTELADLEKWSQSEPVALPQTLPRFKGRQMKKPTFLHRVSVETQRGTRHFLVPRDRAFTMEEAVTLNGKMGAQSIRKYLLRLMETGEMNREIEEQNGHRGGPRYLYFLKSARSYLKQAA